LRDSTFSFLAGPGEKSQDEVLSLE